jgi:hypothetical protein
MLDYRAPFGFRGGTSPPATIGRSSGSSLVGIPTRNDTLSRRLEQTELVKATIHRPIASYRTATVIRAARAA